MEIPTIQYGDRIIHLPIEFSLKKKSIIQDHKVLIDQHFGTEKFFVLYNRIVKFEGNSLIRVNILILFHFFCFPIAYIYLLLKKTGFCI